MKAHKVKSLLMVHLKLENARLIQRKYTPDKRSALGS